MGMSATQARYLSLIAQQSDLEFQGQQINESRTTLSEQTNNLYSQLQNMSVPTPPMTAAYTTIQYTAKDDVVSWALGAIRPSATDYSKYCVDMSFQDVGHNLSQTTGKVPVKAEDAKLKVVETEVPFLKTGNLKPVADGETPSYYLAKKDTRSGEPTEYTYDDLKNVPEDELANYYRYDETSGNYIPIKSKDDLEQGGKYLKKINQDEYDAKLDRLIEADPTTADAKMAAYAFGVVEEVDDSKRAIPVEDLSKYYVNVNGEAINLNTPTGKALLTIDEKAGVATLTDPSMTVYKEASANATEGVTELDNPYKGKPRIGGKTAMEWSEILDMYPKLDVSGYAEAIQHCFGEDSGYDFDSFLYTVTEKTAGNPEITFYLKNDIDGNSTNGQVNGYKYQVSTFTNEKTIDQIELEFDQSGRITKLWLPTFDDNGNIISTRPLEVEAKTVTDEKAYADAMADYEHDKYLYDQEQTAINAQMSIIQAEDKKLELKLTRLDNERTQITTEIEALEKVINDNIEASYKTFSG